MESTKTKEGKTVTLLGIEFFVSGSADDLFRYGQEARHAYVIHKGENKFSRTSLMRQLKDCGVTAKRFWKTKDIHAAMGELQAQLLPDWLAA